MAKTVDATTTKQAFGRKQTTRVTETRSTQKTGAQISTETQVRGAHTVTSSSTRGALTQTAARPLHVGMIVRFRIPVDLMEPVTPDEADLGPSCS